MFPTSVGTLPTHVTWDIGHSTKRGKCNWLKCAKSGNTLGLHLHNLQYNINPTGCCTRSNVSDWISIEYSLLSKGHSKVLLTRSKHEQTHGYNLPATETCPGTTMYKWSTQPTTINYWDLAIDRGKNRTRHIDVYSTRGAHSVCLLLSINEEIVT